MKDYRGLNFIKERENIGFLNSKDEED